jgi:hypothetical protein
MFNKEHFLDLVDMFPLFRRARRACGIIRFKGVFTVECLDSQGRIKWKRTANNGVTNVGKNHIYNVQFFTTAKSATWYLGLVDNAGFSAFAAADTMASHAGWVENTANYTEGVRQTWVTIAAAAGVIANSAFITFTITGSATIEGLFCVDNNVKGGTAGNLWATASFNEGDAVVASPDLLRIVYTVTAT